MSDRKIDMIGFFVKLCISTGAAVSLSYFIPKIAVYIYNRYRRNTSYLYKSLKLPPNLYLSEHESILLQNVTIPEQMNVSFRQIGGLDSIIKAIKQSVILPLCHPEIFDEIPTALRIPRGVLLYGPPGCGKSMLAKAIAKESEARFINVTTASINDKWLGESEKFVRALFSLAQKISPAIIFIDEIDAFMKHRKNQEHEAVSNMKAEFLSAWDGLLTMENTNVLVLGATNRPFDIDEAFSRRMPLKFKIDRPQARERIAILKNLLCGVHLSEEFDFQVIAEQTHNFTGSDLKDCCRRAMISLANETVQKQLQSPDAQQTTALADLSLPQSPNSDWKKICKMSKLRPLKTQDFANIIDEALFEKAQELVF